MTQRTDAHKYMYGITQ